MSTEAAAQPPAGASAEPVPPAGSGTTSGALLSEPVDALAPATEEAEGAASPPEHAVPGLPGPSEPVERRAARQEQPEGDVEPDDGGASGQARRLRVRLSRLGGRPTGHAVLEPVLCALREHHAKADVRPVVKAYEVAETCHRGVFRRSGDPYITHPLAVTQLLAELGMDTTTLVAGLLHDTVEDTSYTLSRVEAEFGQDVRHLVDGCTKLDKVKYGQQAQAETIRKMIVAMARDPRVLVIKLADRLHNMRTLRFLPQEKQTRKARETLEIYAPLAHRLGMNTLKWELEDLAFATLYPKRYEEIVRLVAERAPSRETQLEEVVEAVRAELRAARIRATVSGRPKHYWSIYQKMVVRGREFSDINDLMGVRVLVDTTRDCYAVVGALHSLWNPVAGRFKDYIAMPKFNLYQSLHTTVMGSTGKPVEVQIRTEAMHRTAEYGIAAHWRYKERKGADVAGPPGRSDGGTTDLSWLRQLVEWQRETSDPSEFLEALRFDLGAAEVYVFTPKGDVMALPAGATPVDFAYAVHTEVGHRCIGARVNGRLVPLDSVLENGDTVEIFTSRSERAGPSRDWSSFVTSPRARNKIRQWFAKERREDAVEEGKAGLARAARKEGLPLQRLLRGDALAHLATSLGHADVEALYAAMGEGHVGATTVVRKLVESLGGLDGATEDLAEGETTGRPASRAVPAGDGAHPGVVVAGTDDVWVRLARCCHPVPGDDIGGFVTRGQGVSVHRTSCVNLTASATGEPERVLDVSWAPRSGSTYEVEVEVEALDRTSLLADVTRALSENHVNIVSATLSTSRDRVARSRFAFEVSSSAHLNALLSAIRRVDGVYAASRVAPA